LPANRFLAKSLRQREHGPESALLSQFHGATDSSQKSFAALMLAYSHGDAIDMACVVAPFRLKLASVNDCAQNVLANAAKT
jgi:hypothetical protein